MSLVLLVSLVKIQNKVEFKDHIFRFNEIITKLDGFANGVSNK